MGYMLRKILNTQIRKMGLYHKKGELVAQGTISSEGTVDFKNLYLGNYFVKRNRAGRRVSVR